MSRSPSRMPPNMPPNRPSPNRTPPVPPQVDAPPKMSGPALASMILGLLAMPLVFVYGIGIFLGVFAIVFGIISLVSINNNPRMYAGKGFAITGLVAGGGGVLVMGMLYIILFHPFGGAFSRNDTLSNRSYCAANIRGITQSMLVYAGDGDTYPIVGQSWSSTLAGSAPGTPNTADVLLSKDSGGLYSTPLPGNVCQNMWIMVINGQVAPKQFLCKSDPAGGPAAPMASGSKFNVCFTNPAAGASPDLTYSYSFAFMWSDQSQSMGGWWHNDCDAGVPLIADMAPANGTGSPASNTLDGTNRLANSFNHNRDGQNVGFGDGHGEFVRTAAAGQDNDNIYSSNGSAGASPKGTIPSSAGNVAISGGAKFKWDVCLVPAADANAGYQRK